MDAPQRLRALVEGREDKVLERWLALLSTSGHGSTTTLRAGERRAELAPVLSGFREALQDEQATEPLLEAPAGAPLREALARLSQNGARRGVTPAQTVAAVLFLKGILSTFLREEDGLEKAFPVIEWTDRLVDQMGLFLASKHQEAREAIIVRQQSELLELSTPVITIWDGILALPIIGTLDSSRTQTVMESLLQRIVETESDIAIIDITGVPTVDTLTAQHLLKTVTATRLMGADSIISGIRPQIAQTLVQLGVNLGDVLTRATLAGALALALKRRRLTITPLPSRQDARARAGS